MNALDSVAMGGMLKEPVGELIKKGTKKEARGKTGPTEKSL